jgi:uncharacterized protein YjbI with pentapeptide repeats
MANADHFKILQSGVSQWNAWRKAEPAAVPDLSQADLVRANLSGFDLSGAQLSECALDGSSLIDANLSNAALNGASLTRCNLLRANLAGAKFSMARAPYSNFAHVDASGAQFDGAFLWFSEFTGAKCAGAVFRDAGLRGAWFDKADLTNVDFTYASFIKTHMDDAVMDNCAVYGASVWDLQGTPAKQQNLIISPDGEPVIAVDDFKVAQFIRLLSVNAELRNVIQTVGRKVVLILGRFTPERKAVLDSIRDELRKHNFVPLMFDFDRPDDRSRIDTVLTLAHLSRFVIADLTDAKVLLQELQAILTQVSTLPVLPILQKGAGINVVIADFTARANFIRDVFQYQDTADIAAQLTTRVIEPAEAHRVAFETAQAEWERQFQPPATTPPPT